MFLFKPMKYMYILNVLYEISFVCVYANVFKLNQAESALQMLSLSLSLSSFHISWSHNIIILNGVRNSFRVCVNCLSMGRADTLVGRL